MKFLTNLDLSQNQLLNARIHVSPSAPSVPLAGQVYFSSTTNTLQFYSGSGWVNPLDRTQHTGTQTVSTLSDFATAVNQLIAATTLTSLSAPTGTLSLNGQRITSLADGVGITDAATYGQVLNLVNGINWKQPARVATSSPITLSGLQTIDDVTVVNGDRVLVKNQADGTQNGIYVVSTGAWTRASDADTSLEVSSQMTLMIQEGTTYGSTQWKLITPLPITLGSTALEFAQIGAATSYTAGPGLTLIGNQFSINTAVVARRVDGLIGNGSATTITFTHGLNQQYVTCQVFEAISGANVLCDIVLANTTSVTLTFAIAPALNQYRVVVIG